MRINELSWEGPPPIDSYGAGGFRIQDEFRTGHLLLTPEEIRSWAPHNPLIADDFAMLENRAGDIDVLLIGMGAEIAPLPADVRAALEAAGHGYDLMSTGSACRTYNVLLSEGRRVAAALIAV